MLQHRITNNSNFFDVQGYEHEEDMETIYQLLLKYYVVKIINVTEGPGATNWQLQIDGFEIALINNAYGCFLKPNGDLACEFLKVQQEKIGLILSRNI